MKRLELSVAADSDLFDLLAYGTAVHGEAASDTYFAGMSETFDFLCRNAEAGQGDEVGGLGLRRWRYWRHRIFYRVDEGTVLVVRIFHVAADAVRRLSDGSNSAP